MGNTYSYLKTVSIILGLTLVLAGFQNCAEAVFGTRGAQSTDGDETVTGDVGDDDPTDDGEDKDDDDNDGPCHRCSSRPKRLVGTATAAFEDLFPTARNASDNDKDYNDFVVSYKVKERYSKRGLKRIDIEFKPKAKLAGYDHQLLINLVGRRSTYADRPDNIESLPAFKDDCATAVLQTYAADGSLLSVEDVDPLKDITVFQSTSALFNSQKQPKVRSVLTVYLHDARKTPVRSTLELNRYRVMMKVKNTSEILELVDININQLDSEGYPYGIRIPNDSFDHPLEQQNIAVKYPRFADYRSYLLLKSSNLNYVGSDDAINWFVNSLMILGQNI